MSQPDPLGWLAAELKTLRDRELHRSLRVAGSPSSGALNFATNDYLGLASDPRVVAAASEAAREFGWGSGASALVSGWKEPHERLVRALADFEHAEAAALFPTGFAANLGTIQALVGQGDAVYLDRLNHASLIDGARLSGATLRVYPHNDAESLARTLERDRGRFRRTLIATDSVFSMDGDLAPIGRLVELAEQFGAILLVDEAHGTGVFGPGGEGVCAELGLSDRVPVRIGTLSKALGSIGGFVVGSQMLIDFLVNRARALIYSTASPPASAAAALAAIEIVRTEPERRQRLREIQTHLRDGLARLGIGDVAPGSAPIVALILGSPERALRYSRALGDRGLNVPAIRPPTVPHGTSRLRISLSAALDVAAIDRLLQALAQARGEIDA